MQLIDIRTNETIEVGESVRTVIGNNFVVKGVSPAANLVTIQRGYTTEIEVEPHHINAIFSML